MPVSPRRLSLGLLLVASSAFAREPSVDGEPFTARKVVDRQQGGIVAYAFRAPEKWKDTSEVFWNYGNINTPVTSSATVENPANEEAVFFFQPAMFFTFRPDNGAWRDGYVSGGMVKARPQPPLPTLTEYVRRKRGALARFRFVGSKDLPDLPGALKVNMATDQRGVAVKVAYELKGRPVEEEFYAVHCSQDLPAGGGQRRDRLGPLRDTQLSRSGGDSRPPEGGLRCDPEVHPAQRRIPEARRGHQAVPDRAVAT
jgi:hypothetical protein